MKLQIRDIALSAIAAAVLPFVFVAFQSLLAHCSAGAILALAAVLGDKIATLSVVHSFGVMGAFVSALIVAMPLGLALKQRPRLSGAIVGLLAAGYLAVISIGGLGIGAIVEFAVLVVGASLAAGLGNSLRRRTL